MRQRSTSRARLGLVSAALMALVVFSTGPVAADTGPIGDATFSQVGKSADAFSGECAPNGDGTTTCSFTSVSVFLGRMSDNVTSVTRLNQVCAYLDTATFVDETGEYVGDPITEAGCEVDLPRGVLAFGTKLTTASLAATTVSIQAIHCDNDTGTCVAGPSRDVTVVGTWTGVGPTFVSKYRFSGADGTCRYAESGRGSSREATFSGSVDGIALAGDVSAWMADGKQTFRSRCIEI